MNRICIYLRKSRADEELEKTLGRGETLSKHRKALLQFAKKENLNIIEIKEEIVSGESLFFRPKMLELLKEIENNRYDGVLVMDMQRLGRGDMQDQGIILKTFKNANTKIITPQKSYDLNDDFDEEYSEFEAFMSRKELKMINRRMQSGRVRSIEDGNYISPNPPLGYDINFIGKNRTLKPNEHEAEIIRLIFKMYIENHGAGTIAKELNDLGYRSRTGKDLESSSILFILKNPVYIGKVTWRKKDIKKSTKPNKSKDTRTRDVSEWIIATGKHKPIITTEVFQEVQSILKGKYHIPYKIANGAANPLAGIITCGICGNKMVLRKYGDKSPHIICTKKCGNKSSRFDFIEKAIIQSLENYLIELKSNTEEVSINDDTIIYKRQIQILNKKLSTLASQKLKLFDLLEQGLYDNKTFLQRSNNISLRYDKIEEEMRKLKFAIKRYNIRSGMDLNLKVKSVIDNYKNSNNIITKNELLKNILQKIEYRKLSIQKGSDFELRLFLKL